MDVEWDGIAWHDLRALVFRGLALGNGAKDDYDMTTSFRIRWALMSLLFRLVAVVSPVHRQSAHDCFYISRLPLSLADLTILYCYYDERNCEKAWIYPPTR